MKPSPVPRTPPALRSRLDRLARRAHAFHRFAHHPLCVEYANERLQAGRLRLCKGCTLLAAGLLLGLTAGSLIPSHLFWSIAALSLALLLGLGSYWTRPSKFLGRFLPGMGLTFSAVQGLRSGPHGWVLTFLAALAFILAGMLYRRRGPDRTPCETCPERDLRPACRGFKPILRRERALQRWTGRMISVAQRAHWIE